MNFELGLTYSSHLLPQKIQKSNSESENRYLNYFSKISFGIVVVPTFSLLHAKILKFITKFIHSPLSSLQSLFSFLHQWACILFSPSPLFYFLFRLDRFLYFSQNNIKTDRAYKFIINFYLFFMKYHTYINNPFSNKLDMSTFRPPELKYIQHIY